MKNVPLFFCLVLACTSVLSAQQVADTSQFFTIEQAAYPEGQGPRVWVDAGHHNFHTIEGRYAAFGNVLKVDGYQVADQPEPITAEVLADCEIYVIANPLHESNKGNWTNPCPSAFTATEIEVVRQWVEEGGSLFLIADHMPFGGAAAELGAAFGVEWSNCFALDNRRRNFDRFSRKKGNLVETALTQGINRIVTFTGSAFQAPENAEIIVALSDDFTLLSPEIAWEFTDDTPHQSAAGWQQIAYFEFGAGRVVISGEAAMFSAQLGGPQRQKFGMNTKVAKENVQLLRNLVGWLAGN
ncbi:MAG: hypothetical protein AAFY48_04880 [Bacteroidota bacterium]